MLRESAKLDELLHLDLVKYVTEVKTYQIYDLITTLLPHYYHIIKRCSCAVW